MNARLVAAIIGHLGNTPRDFLGGWMEGRTRYMVASSKDVISGSIFERGTVRFAASQAAVAYHQALGDA